MCLGDRCAATVKAEESRTVVPARINQLVIELATELGKVSTHDDAVERIVRLAAASVDTDLAGITLMRARGQLETVAPTDPLVEQADQLQYDLHEGPCVEAAAESTSFIAGDLATDDRWPNWGPQVATLGLGSILAVDLNVGHRRIGALNLYGAGRRAFSQDDLDTAILFATVGAATLGFVEQVDGLTRAVDSRTIIGQAQGIVMKTFDIDAERAFDVLRRHSQDRNVKLAEIAAQVVETGQLPT